MIIFLNNGSAQVLAGASLYFTLQQNSLHDKSGIAVAVNNQVVPKSLWDKTTLHENDKITVIKATQGG